MFNCNAIHLLGQLYTSLGLLRITIPDSVPDSVMVMALTLMKSFRMLCLSAQQPQIIFMT